VTDAIFCQVYTKWLLLGYILYQLSKPCDSVCYLDDCKNLKVH